MSFLINSVPPLSCAALEAINNLLVDFTSTLSTKQSQQTLEAFAQLDFISRGTQHPKLFQLKCMISLLSARNIVLRAATGSGKTLRNDSPVTSFSGQDSSLARQHATR
ncbi:uncharacterized protein F5147DRAFT_726080 [Suillus discolor]|uniref:Uncharacterized protein n=1 Tax=Suillus discolor TaxID=1912936 RepID=A0A9P7JM47_9AGAM|nr:uncharacterized protein F5147DRAFT_726080 [Suillus discolor]KAG2089344.1 hypothetical protein F5147DRAFT_726080 [Suillus discolor]